MKQSHHKFIHQTKKKKAQTEKVIQWELCKKLAHVHKPESALDNEMHKILWDFEIQMNHPIPAERPDQEKRI